jgi:osmotically-inducible protein OsmY
VRYLTGLVGVVNLIVVSPHATPTEIKRNIEEALRRTAELDARHVDVDVRDGEVILRGTVHSLAEKDEAERAAWAAPGVRKVEDLITVEP